MGNNVFTWSGKKYIEHDESELRTFELFVNLLLLTWI